MITLGFCRCGCGQRTNICRINYPKRGFVKGQPMAFVHGHNARTHGRSYKAVGLPGYQKRELHRFIAERALGKQLPRRVQVHHVDENYQNNANGNLVICEDMAYHKLLHMRADVVRAGGNPNTDLFCHACKAAKHASVFYDRKQKKNGKASRCKACVRTDVHRRYQFKKQQKEALRKAS